MRDVFYKFYKDGRHEMLNETNRDEVYNDILNWLFKKLLKRWVRAHSMSASSL